jgi:UDP-N-acetylmuramoyl-tripeptide--D-alanyl-D-alanine ligase
MPEPPNSEPLWTSSELLAATGGRLAGRAFDVTGVTFDSREVEPGDLFVALKGERDGHAFARSAFEREAAGALVSQPVDGPHIEVPDTLVGLERLGIAARERARARRAAVTGSVGKTSVTQALKAALERAGPAHGSVKSFNNHIGVPLTLARMPKGARRAVFEIGMNHSGEIEPLSKLVRPHAVAITTVGPVHIENFADGEAGVAAAKAEIFAGLEPGGTAVLNAEDRWFGFLAERALAAGARVLTFGSGEDCDAQLLAVEAAPSGSRIRARLEGRALDFPIAQSGQHWGLNSLCVLLLAGALEVPAETALEALAGFAPLAGRGIQRTVHGPAGDFLLIDESYNANPISMRAALKTLGAAPARGRRIAVLTDMLELGAEAEGMHAGLAGPIDEAGVDLVFCAGPLMRALWDALPASRRGGWAESAETLADALAPRIGAGDVVMVKGSNGSRAGVIAKALAASGESALTKAGGAA